MIRCLAFSGKVLAERTHILNWSRSLFQGCSSGISFGLLSDFHAFPCLLRRFSEREESSLSIEDS